MPMKTHRSANVGALWLGILMAFLVFTAWGDFQALAEDTSEITFYVQ